MDVVHLGCLGKGTVILILVLIVTFSGFCHSSTPKFWIMDEIDVIELLLGPPDYQPWSADHPGEL